MEEYDSVYNDDDDYEDNSDCDYDGESFDGYAEVEQESNNRLCEASSCNVIRKESLLAAQKEDLQRVMDLLSLKEHHARTLLIHYRWNVDKVIAILVERGSEKLFAEAGVTLEGEDEHASSLPPTEITCQICFEVAPAEKTTVMDCNHRFCNDCWTTHFIVQIDEGNSKRIACMAHKCNAICDEGKIRDLVTAKDPTLAEKFDRFLLESYIEDNKRVKWCPSVPHCGNAIRIEGDEYSEVECACGLQFCFNCLSEVHSPCSCLMWERWMTKSKGDDTALNWVNYNAKRCPKCHNPVEKNGGCNLVRCKCGHLFCYNERQEKNTETVSMEKDLSRYMQYYERYTAHCDLLKVEKYKKKKLHVKVIELEARELQSKNFSWLTNGFDRLLRSRRILSCSYPFAFYMFGNALFVHDMTPDKMKIKQDLFENLQQQLEMNVERLSLFLQEPFADYSEDKLLETRMKIITLSTVTDDLCLKLYDCIESDLLVHLKQATHTIAQYRSNGVEKASELPNINILLQTLNVSHSEMRTLS